MDITSVLTTVFGNVGTTNAAVGAGTVASIPAIMAGLKKLFPNWDKKAWAPLLIGGVLMLLAGYGTGQITSIPTAINYILAGLGAGGTASSIRDIFKGI